MAIFLPIMIERATNAGAVTLGLSPIFSASQTQVLLSAFQVD